MKHLITAAGLAGALVLSAPAFAAQDMAPGAAAANQINGSAESNPPNAKTSGTTVASSDDSMMSRLHNHDNVRTSASSPNGKQSDTSADLAAKANAQ